MYNYRPTGVPPRAHPLPQKLNAVSSGVSTLPPRPPLPTRLSGVRSASQQSSLVDLTTDDHEAEDTQDDSSQELRHMRSPENIAIDRDDLDDLEPRAKRIKTETSAYHMTENVGDVGQVDVTREYFPGSPLPTLPKAKPPVKRTNSSRRQRFGIEPAARKAHGLAPPIAATRVPAPRKILDFSPWTGSHPEDVLNETATKTGYFDKAAGTNPSECNPAKSIVWPNLSQKGHAGLSMLSYLFSAVLEKRQALGKCIASSTFKPPPRVTVTDAKREAWLRDLANSEVPLRKQSRTIPHGIRGKLLMEQCLSKEIPLQRAVWLAKCVGANELRAFRRKGISGSATASGEGKWVREWTVQVEQFLEAVVGTCGQQDWQQNMNYAVKLVASFYTEKLLESDHFLDWIVSSLTAATTNDLPIWLVLVQIFWKDLTSYATRGRCLAVSILEHLHCIVRANLHVHEPLKTRLHKLIAILAISKRGCLIIPDSWEKYKHLLTPKSTTSPGDGGQLSESLARNIAKRNERLAAPLSKTAFNSHSAIVDLYTKLDSITLDVDVENLTEECRRLIPDSEQLIPALLDWASTPYRTGTARIYLSADIISRLQNPGIDGDAIILKYLAKANAVVPTVTANIHKVVVDLVRRESFSVGRYLKWLITSGIMYSDQDQTCATSLIAALVDEDLPLHVRNTKRMLMSRLEYATREEADVHSVLAQVSEVTAQSSTDSLQPVKIPDSLSMSARLSISRQLCSKASISAKDFGLSVETFQVTRMMVEQIGDIRSLGALLVTASSTEDSVLLASIADTTNYHADALAGMSELSPLIERLSEQYFILRAQQPLDRALILSLTMLAKRLPQRSAFVRILVGDLTLCEQQNADVVCSPASDNLIGMHATSLDSDEDMDAVFASGNTMDEQLMGRVFARIVQRATKLTGSEFEVHRVCGWLNRLRSVDGSSGVFDRLVSNTLQTSMNSLAEVEFSPNVITCLVSSGCISLGSVALRAREITNPRMAWNALRLFLPAEQGAQASLGQEAYQFRLQQRRCQEEHTESLVMLVHIACEEKDFPAEDTAIIEFIIRCVAAKPGLLRRTFDEGSRSETIRANAGRLVTAVLYIGNTQYHSADTIDQKLVIQMATPLSIPYCIGALRFFMTCESSRERANAEDLADAVLECFQNRSEVWSQLLSIAGDEANMKLHQWARNQLLYLANKDGEYGNAATQDHTKRCLCLLAATSNAAACVEDYACLAVITEKLQDLHRRLTSINIFVLEGQTALAGLIHQLRIILHICVMPVHCKGVLTEPAKHAKCNLLATLCTLLVHPHLQTDSHLMEYLFDLSSGLSQHLPDASSLWPSSVKLPSDPRLTSILGQSAHAGDSSLMLASQAVAAGSQQQRTLNKLTPQPQQPQQQASPRPGWPAQPSPGGLVKSDGRLATELKTVPFAVRPWEIIPDPTPVMGENDACLSLTLFAARKV